LAPRPLGPAINTSAREYAPFVSPDGSFLLFVREDRELGVDSFFLSFKTPDGLWTEAIYLREYVPTVGHCLSASVTPDGAYLVYVELTPSGRRSETVGAGFIEELRQQVFGYASARSSSPTRR
jgi:Tol biopolymer transport system component